MEAEYGYIQNKLKQSMEYENRNYKILLENTYVFD